MGRKSRIKKEGQLKGMYKMLRKEGKVESYTFGKNEKTGKRKTMDLNPLKHILLLKRYKDADALYLLMIPHPQKSALFPYTTLFRSQEKTKICTCILVFF